MKNILAFALFGMMLFSMAFAENETNATKPDVLGLKYGMIECRVNAVISLVDYGEELNVSGGENISDTLSSDLETLKTYADSGNRKEFNTFVSKDLRSDLRDAVFYLKDVRREVMRAERGGTGNKTPVQEYFVQVKQERAECIQSVALAFAQEQVGEFEERLANMNKTIGALKNKSVDTSELEEIEAEAEENLNRMKEAVEGGNVTDIVATAKEIREQHLHIWARFHIAKLQAVLDAVDDEAIAKGYAADVEAIRVLLSDAERSVQPGVPYNAGEFEQVKKDLKGAHAKLRELIKKTRGA